MLMFYNLNNVLLDFFCLINTSWNIVVCFIKIEVYAKFEFYQPKVHEFEFVYSFQFHFSTFNCMLKYI
jgi:hypothetical protein